MIITCYLSVPAEWASSPDLELAWCYCVLDERFSRCDSSKLRRNNKFAVLVAETILRALIACVVPRLAWWWVSVDDTG